jgi:hypothetical protein
MRSRLRAWFVLVSAVSAAAWGCKEAGQDRPLPTPEPPAAASTAPRADPAAAPKKRAPVEEVKEAPEKTPAASPSSGTRGAPAALPSAGAKPAGSTTTTTPSSAPATSAAPVPTLAAPSAACLSRCQGAMQGCLSAPVDGGVPGFANLDLCKKAFEACQAACKQ